VELFHYHYWTPDVEEVEKCYETLGFSVVTRIGKVDGEFQQFNPPMRWDDFRSKKPIFRIIEMRKGKVNVTFGYGKKPIFDHLGILVLQEEYDGMCIQAKKMGWAVEEDERRTFIYTPYQMKVELQLRRDVVEEREVYITNLHLVLPTQAAIQNMQNLLGEVKQIVYTLGVVTSVKQVYIEDTENYDLKDSNGLHIKSHQPIEIREITDDMRQEVKECMIKNWGDDLMVSRGYMHFLSKLHGFVAMAEHSIIGIVTYNIENGKCEVVSLDSFAEKQGIGTMLLGQVENMAKQSFCKEMWLITSNDNTHAMHFYQKRGYHMEAIYKGAINEARKLKPTIPYVNNQGIPIESEVEFKKKLS
jgi:ribosomal protein S18 acetylase RimI-like enzyme